MSATQAPVSGFEPGATAGDPSLAQPSQTVIAVAAAATYPRA